MSVPRRFVGAWEREHLEIDGRTAPGIGRALWIEGGGTYVDIRSAGTVASGTSFGGRSTWRSPVFTWRHDLDAHPRPGSVDRGELSLVDDRIVERGVGIDGGTATYEEHWRRLPTANLDLTVAAHAHGIAVRVGDHAGLLVALPGAPAFARAWRFADGQWLDEITLGSPGAHPEPRESNWQLTPGWHLGSGARANRPT